jgi:kumamolisin
MPSPSEKREVLVLLRPNKSFQPPELDKHRKHIAIEELLRGSAAEREDMQAISRFAAKNRLKILSIDASKRTIVLSGSAPALALLKKLPAVMGVFGMNKQPVVKRPGRRKFPPEESMTPPPLNANTRAPKDFRELYQFPKHATGKGQCIGVLEFGGGFSPPKLRSYLRKLGVHDSHVKVREIAPGGNRPVNLTGKLSPDAEVYMDLEILASVAPDATLVVYFAENSSRGWIEALHAAIFDRTHRISVLSISWGQAELRWDRPTIAAIDHLFQMAALLGITVCCSSGDRGVFEEDAQPYSVPFPASSPNVLACGGTRLDILGARQRETVWNESHTSGLTTGGGISRVFGAPTFQQAHPIPTRFGGTAKGRGIPDVSANASAATGYLIWADNIAMSLGGTSATAPLWAGLIACLNEALGRRVGYLTPLLYASKRNPGLRNITKGNNRLNGRQGYDARKTWDACTGLGSPHGLKLLEWLKRSAGLPS